MTQTIKLLQSLDGRTWLALIFPCVLGTIGMMLFHKSIDELEVNLILFAIGGVLFGIFFLDDLETFNKRQKVGDVK